MLPDGARIQKKWRGSGSRYDVGDGDTRGHIDLAGLDRGRGSASGDHHLHVSVAIVVGHGHVATPDVDLLDVDDGLSDGRCDRIRITPGLLYGGRQGFCPELLLLFVAQGQCELVDPVRTVCDRQVNDIAGAVYGIEPDPEAVCDPVELDF